MNKLIICMTCLIGMLCSSYPLLAQEKVMKKGSFEGRSDHSVTGGVSVLETNNGYVIRLEENFVLDGAPDPRVALGKDGYDEETLHPTIIEKTGKQEYTLAEGVDPKQYNEVWIWCKQFEVPLGVAKIE